MHIGFIGLGKMGFNLVLNLLRHNHTVVGYDINETLVNEIKAEGAQGVHTLDDLYKALPDKRILWLMIPAGPLVDKVIEQLLPLVQAGDITGNADRRDLSIRALRVLPGQIALQQQAALGCRFSVAKDDLMSAEMRNAARHVRKKIEIVGGQLGQTRQAIGELGESKSCLHVMSDSLSRCNVLWPILRSPGINV